MKKIFVTCLFLGIVVFNTISAHAQVMTPELLWSLKRLSPIGLTKDGKEVIFSVSQYNLTTNGRTSKTYTIPLTGGAAIEINDYSKLIADKDLSPEGKNSILTKEVKIKPIAGTDFYPDLDKSNVYIFDNLNYRHWDTWEDGKYAHLFIKNTSNNSETDIMKGEPYDCPTMPFGGSEDYTWNNDGSKVIYVTKKVYGTEYAKSTNTDIYSYDLATKTTSNLTEENKGYDTQPAFSNDGTLAWLQMEEPGYEADKNDIILLKDDTKINLTKHWDGTVNGFLWANDGKSLYFIAPVDGTTQLFEVTIPKKGQPEIRQITNGQFNVASMVGQSNKTMVITRTDMNHAAEIYTVDLKKGDMTPLTHINDETYNKIKLS
ncbi:MAG: DPP IV N-terminal domain-containing protein, partial [Cyclobacteriaceae bacterium]|nr:DPP IV N-terminal domain-containing protein [Cyclobacteriaceae bacterium]